MNYICNQLLSGSHRGPIGSKEQLELFGLVDLNTRGNLSIIGFGPLERGNHCLEGPHKTMDFMDISNFGTNATFVSTHSMAQ